MIVTNAKRKKTTSITVETCRLQLKQELPELFHKTLSVNEEYCCQQITFTCKWSSNLELSQANCICDEES